MKRPYFLEPSLPVSVQKYMNENKIVDVEDMTDFLISTYREFHSKKKTAFIKSVRRAYEWELYTREKNTQMNTSNMEDSDDIYEIDKNGTRKTPEKTLKYPSTDFLNTLYKRPDIRSSDTYQEGSKVKRKKKMNSDDTIVDKPLKPPAKFKMVKPNVSFKDMKGIESLSETVCLFANNFVKNVNRLEDAPKYILVIGPDGSGKSMFISAFATLMNAHLMKFPIMEMIYSTGLNSFESLKNDFKEALNQTPVIVYLDNLEILAMKDTYSKGPEKKVSDQIASILSDKKLDESSMVFAEVRNPENLDSNLRSLFDMEMFMPVIDRESRCALLRELCTDLEPNFNFGEIALRTSSFVAGDIKKLVQKTRHCAWKRCVQEKLGARIFKDPEEFLLKFENCKDVDPSIKIELSDFVTALPTVIPTLKKEGFPEVPETTWSDVGGLEDIKNELIEKILAPMLHSHLYEEFGAKKPNGILLWGPPGCGKTLLAKAVANHAGVNLLVVMGPELLNMYQGESERAMREVFRRASSVSPCVIFFDEFDCICPRRVGSDSGSKTTIVNTLLSEMNGFKQRKDVHIMAATNRPDIIDPAVLRPERFDTTLYVGLPDLQGRIAILKASTKNGTKPKLAPDVNLEEIAGWCNNFSGADCAQLVYMASITAIKDKIDEEMDVSDDRTKVDATLYKKHFISAFSRVSPSVNEEEQLKYLRMKNKLGKATKSDGNLSSEKT